MALKVQLPFPVLGMDVKCGCSRMAQAKTKIRIVLVVASPKLFLICKMSMINGSRKRCYVKSGQAHIDLNFHRGIRFELRDSSVH